MQMLFTDAPEYTKLAKSYSRVFSYKPAAICLPEKDGHVVDAIRLARAPDVKFQPKGGGHSYAAYSSGGQDDSLILHMKNFSAVDLNNDTKIAWDSLRRSWASEPFPIGQYRMLEWLVISHTVATDTSHEQQAF